MKLPSEKLGISMETTMETTGFKVPFAFFKSIKSIIFILNYGMTGQLKSKNNTVTVNFFLVNNFGEEGVK